MRSDKPSELPDKYSPSMLATMDNRTKTAQIFKARVNALAIDLGGWSSLSYAQRSLCERAVHLEALMVASEEALARGEAVDPTLYLARLNALSGLFNRLGMKRVTKQKTLADVIRQNKGGAE